MEEHKSRGKAWCLSPIEEKRGRAAVGVDGSDSDIDSGAHK